MSETSHAKPRLRIIPVLMAVTGFVAAVTFALSALGLFGFAHDGMRLSVEAAWMVPLGVDLLSVAGMVATYALRNSRTRRRVYAWTVFGFAVVASVAGNEAHAAERNLPPAGMAAAALPPVFLALAVHLLIVVRRDLETVPLKFRPPALTPPVVAQVAGHTPRPAAPSAAPALPPGEAIPPAALPKAPRGRQGSGRRATGDVRARALQLLRDGSSCAEAALAVGVSKRSVELWRNAAAEAAKLGGGANVDAAN